MENALIVFVRIPERGKVKTRLAAEIGADAALSVYKRLLAHTCTISEDVKAAKFIFYVDEIGTADIWDKPEYFKLEQEGVDLGERMQCAFELLFKKGYEKVCIIGSDCYELLAETVNRAFEILDRADLVIGPAQDGGYYLLGMKQLHKDVFQNKKWSTNSVLENTIKDATRLGLSIVQLQLLRDVDEWKDLPIAWSAEVKKL